MGTIGMQVLEAQRVLPPHAHSRNPTRLSVQAEVRDLMAHREDEFEEQVRLCDQLTTEVTRGGRSRALI